MSKTLIDLFRESVDKYPDNPFMWQKDGDEFRSVTYRASFEIVASTAAGLIEMGLAKGDRVLLLSEGRNDWVFSELAIFFAGGICVPVTVKLQQPAELRFRLSHSGTRFAIVSGRQSQKILKIKNDLPDLEKVIVLDIIENAGDDVLTMADVRAQGKTHLKQNADKFHDRWQSVTSEDPANICYTSGTTADPKGIVLSHGNFTANVKQANALFTVHQHYISLLILPWDHSFAHTAGIFTLMSGGASMAAVEIGATPTETIKNIGKNIREIRPHFILSVPALSDSFKRNIERGITNLGGRVEKLFQWGLKIGEAYQGDGFRKHRWRGNILLKPLHALFDAIIFSKIREQFGGRLRFFVGGGALLDVTYQRFFAAIGMPIYQGYGLTEASPIISANHPKSLKMGTSGQAVPDMDIRICDEEGRTLPAGQKGEIVVRGANVMQCYWNNPQATADAVKDGWLYTGDMGYLDDEGFLVVLGRFKSLLISNDGEKFSPEGIEESLMGSSPYIHQIMLYNNQNPYTSALIVPNKSLLLSTLDKMGYTCDSKEGQREAIEIFEKAIQKHQTDPMLKDKFPGKWLPSTFAILGEAFSESNQFLNSTMKMVRWRITQHYQDRIEFIYTTEGKNPYNAKNMKIIQRMGQK